MVQNTQKTRRQFTDESFTQTIRRQFADELFDCVHHLVKLALKGLNSLKNITCKEVS